MIAYKMRQTIWKYTITPDDIIKISMPKDAEILSVQNQNGQIQMWALVYPDNDLETRYFEVYGTGHDIHVDMGIVRKFIGTFQINMGSLVFHLFERIN